MMLNISLTVLALILLMMAGLFAGSEMGLYCLNRIRLRLRAAQPGEANAQLLLRLTASESQSILGVLILQHMTAYLLTVVTTLWLTYVLELESRHVEYYAAAILAPLVFTLGDVVPKNWFQIEADRLMYPIARLLYAGVTALRWTGVLWLSKQITHWTARLTSRDEVEAWSGPRGDLVTLLREGAAVGVLTQEQSRFVENIMSLSTVRVGELMIPAAQIASLPEGATPAQFQQIVRSRDYSRLPVISRDGTRVLGIVFVNDVLLDETGGPIESRMEPALTVPARESASSALVRMRREKVPMAVVSDPRRGFVGIITLKDLVEEIFGEAAAW